MVTAGNLMGERCLAYLAWAEEGYCWELLQLLAQVWLNPTGIHPIIPMRDADFTGLL